MDLWEMKWRIARHIAFWVFFMAFFALVSAAFAGPSDLKYPPLTRYFRFFLNELAFLPSRIFPFYLMFYVLIPYYYVRQKYVLFFLFTLITLAICIVGYRLTIPPVLQFMYKEEPGFALFTPRRILVTLTEFIAPVGIAATIKLWRDRIQAQKHQEQLEGEKLNAELRFLKAQTNPHFLFNTLNNLYGLARKKDDNAAPAILKLSNIMRYILHECSNPRVAIQKEVKIIEDYLELEQLRYDDRLSIQLETKVDDWQQEVAPLLLLPFVENAFKHGASESRFESVIEIQLQLAEGQLWFQVTNSQEETYTPSNSGIGLKNVQRQLELLYPDNYQLSIEPKDHSFRIELIINLPQHANTP